MKTITLLILYLLLIACNNSVQLEEVVLSTNPIEVQAMQKYIEKNLKGEDKVLAKQFLNSNAQALAAGYGENMTLEEAIIVQALENEDYIKKEIELHKNGTEIKKALQYAYAKK